MSDTGDQEFRASFARLVNQLLQDDGTPKRGTPLLPQLDAHFATPADELPVVVERIDVHRWADFDIALAEITARDPASRLLGVGGGERHHSTLSDLMAQSEWGRFRQGQVDRLSVAVGPDAERATVAFGLHLFTYQDEPALVLQRGNDPQHGSEARVEVITERPEVATQLLTELRELAVERSVLRGQVISFSGNPTNTRRAASPSPVGQTYRPTG